MVYFTELVLANILSFCGGSVRKGLLPTIQEGYYFSFGKTQFWRNVKVVKIDETHYWIESNWGKPTYRTDTPLTIKKFKKTSDTFVQGKTPVLSISIDTRMECLYNELEWKDLLSNTIQLRMFNLKKGFPVNSNPRTFKEIVRSGCAVEAKGYLEWKSLQLVRFEKQCYQDVRTQVREMVSPLDAVNSFFTFRETKKAWRNEFGQSIQDCLCDLKVERDVLEGMVKKGLIV